MQEDIEYRIKVFPNMQALAWIGINVLYTG